MSFSRIIISFSILANFSCTTKPSERIDATTASKTNNNVSDSSFYPRDVFVCYNPFDEYSVNSLIKFGDSLNTISRYFTLIKNTSSQTNFYTSDTCFVMTKTKQTITWVELVFDNGNRLKNFTAIFKYIGEKNSKNLLDFYYSVFYKMPCFWEGGFDLAKYPNQHWSDNFRAIHDITKKITDSSWSITYTARPIMQKGYR